MGLNRRAWSQFKTFSFEILKCLIGDIVNPPYFTPFLKVSFASNRTEFFNTFLFHLGALSDYHGQIRAFKSFFVAFRTDCRKASSNARISSFFSMYFGGIYGVTMVTLYEFTVRRLAEIHMDILLACINLIARFVYNIKHVITVLSSQCRR